MLHTCQELSQHHFRWWLSICFWHQAIIWPNVDLLLIRMLGIYFGEIWIKIQQFSLKKMNLKMSAKGWPFCLSLSQWNDNTIQGRVHLKNYQICQKLVQCNDYLMSILGQPWCWVCNHAFPAASGLTTSTNVHVRGMKILWNTGKLLTNMNSPSQQSHRSVNLTVCSTACSDCHQRQHQSSVLLVFCRVIHGHWWISFTKDQ